MSNLITIMYLVIINVLKSVLIIIETENIQYVISNEYICFQKNINVIMGKEGHMPRSC